MVSPRYRWAGWLVGLTLLGVIAVPAVFGQELHPTIRLDGIQVHADVPAYIELRAGRTMVPVRALAEPLGYDVAWEQNAQEVTVRRGTQEVRFYIGKAMAEVNGETVKLDVAPRLVRGRAFVPLRFLAEVSGAGVAWDQSSLTVHITTPTSASQAAEEGWANERGGTRRTGFNAGSTVGAGATPEWFSQVTPAGSGMVAGHRMLFVAAAGGKLTALDTAGGKEMWTVSPKGATEMGTPAYDRLRKLVYLPAGNDKESKLHAFDATTGKQVWTATMHGQKSVKKSVPVAVGDLVIVGGESTGATLYAYDAMTGRMAWSGAGSGDVVPAVSGTKLFTGYSNLEAFAYRFGDAGAVWGRPGGSSGSGRYTTLVDGGRVYVGNHKGVAAMDEATGQQLWERTDLETAMNADMATDGTFLWVPVPSGMAVLDADTGNIVQRPAMCHNRAASPVISQSHVFTACDGRVWAIDRATFAVTQVTEGSGPLALDGDRLYYVAPAEPGTPGVVAALSTQQ